VPQADETPPLEEVSEVGEGAEDPVGGGLQGDGKVLPGGGERWKAHELFAESACSQAVLDFL